MKFFTPTTLTTVLCTLSSLSSPASAIPADTKAVAKVGDKPDVEVFLNKRELAERTLNPTTTSSRAARADWRTKVVTTTTTTPARQRPLWYTRTVSSATTTTQAPSFFPAPVSSTTTTTNPSTTPPVVAADNTPIASYSSPAASPVTTTTTTTTPAAAPASTNGLNIRDVSVNEHNRFRALHGAAALTWDQKLADAAQSWASRCIWGHSQGAVGNYGENLASSAGQRGISTDQLVLGLIKLWEDESVDYTPETPNYSHFTQMVWKSTTRIGCALVTCPAGSIFDARYGEAYLACEYDPRGNVYPDENFRANVQP